MLKNYVPLCKIVMPDKAIFKNELNWPDAEDEEWGTVAVFLVMLVKIPLQKSWNPSRRQTWGAGSEKRETSQWCW